MDVPYYSIKHIKDAHLIQFSGLFFLVHYKNQVAVAKKKKKRQRKCSHMSNLSNLQSFQRSFLILFLFLFWDYLQ